MLQWLGQLQTVNFVKDARYTIVYSYSGVQCSAIDTTEVQDHVVGGLDREGLGFAYISPPVVSQSGPSSCEVRIPVLRSDLTTLIDVGPSGPFSGVPGAQLSAVLDESGRDLFRVPATAPPPPSPPPPSPPLPPPPIKESQRSAAFWKVATVVIIVGAVGLALKRDKLI